jgi:hypothetical protein
MTTQIDYPDVKFSPWLHWTKRRSWVDPPETFEKGGKAFYPGIYLFGHFPDEPPSPKTPASIVTDRQVVYVGMTMNLRGRPVGLGFSFLRARGLEGKANKSRFVARPKPAPFANHCCIRGARVFFDCARNQE